MLSRADRPLPEVIREFAAFGVEAGYFVPTAAGLAKSIIDAHESLRRFLRRKGIHDFESQGQGTSHKVIRDIDIALTDHMEVHQISLYRPKSKSGDPRLWVRGLGGVAKPGNLLALFVSAEGRLTLVNCSDSATWSSRLVTGSPLNAALSAATISDSAEELLARLRDICRQGFIPSLRDGPTGIGFTLETHLGIAANSRRAPDFKGIELKAGRTRGSGASATRTTLFSKTPEWKMSALGNGDAILARYGYPEAATGRLQLYCTLASSPNSLGLYLQVAESAAFVEMLGPAGIADLTWPLGDLEKALATKHRETFWVSARQRRSPSGAEEFLFERVTHTRQPLVTNLGPLISSGTVEMDLTLSRKSSGAARDHGYLFKIWQRDLELLFPQPVVHLLAE